MVSEWATVLDRRMSFWKDKATRDFSLATHPSSFYLFLLESMSE